MNSKKYIGMDVHQASICVAVRDEGGKIVMESILETKAATILAFIQGIPGNLWVTFEEGTSAAWLCDLGCCQLKPHETSLGRLTKGNSKSSGRRYPLAKLRRTEISRAGDESSSTDVAQRGIDSPQRHGAIETAGLAERI